MRAKAHRRRQLHRDTDAMTYDGPSQEEFLAELRSRRPSTEVILHRAPLSHPRTERGQTVSSLRISRYDDPDNPVPDRGVYLFSVAPDDAPWSDTWHETVEDAVDQAEFSYEVPPSAWTPPLAAA
jgi:hypothetical protein